MTALAATPSVARIPEGRARSLFRWNAALALLHGAQFVVMLLLSLAQEPMARWPIVSSYLTFDPVTRTLEPAQAGKADQRPVLPALDRPDAEAVRIEAGVVAGEIFA